MKLPSKAVIADEKIKAYLLSYRRRNDKSKWLERAGYNQENWSILKVDIQDQLLPLDAVPVEENEYGQMYKLIGRLTGPNGKTLLACTIWMVENETKLLKFITMFPFKN